MDDAIYLSGAISESNKWFPVSSLLSMPYADKRNQAAYIKKWKEAHPNYNKDWFKTNEGKMREWRRVWWEKNGKATLAQQKGYKAAHKEAYNEYCKKYRKTEKGRTFLTVRYHHRRALIKKQAGLFTGKLWKELKEKFGYCCAICKKKEPFTGMHSQYLTVDHIIPISKGGLHDISNIQPLCFNCNVKKGASF